VDYKCYIDESGDEGIGTAGSRWFILGALIVPQEFENDLLQVVTAAKQRLGVKTLHWTKLKKHVQKQFVCNELLKGNWAYCCVATDKTHKNIVGAPNLKVKDQLYCYTVKLLFERLSWYARDNGNRVAIPIFEFRSGTSYKDMNDYIEKLSCWIPADAVQISWKNIEFRNYKLMPKDKCALLQASDCVVGAIKDGLEYGKLGLVEPSYIQTLSNRLYRRGGNLFSYGLKFLHIKQRDIGEVLAEYQWLKTI
jgi:hypothetical protein